MKERVCFAKKIVCFLVVKNKFVLYISIDIYNEKVCFYHTEKNVFIT